MSYKLLLKEFMLLSNSHLNKITGCNTVVIKTVNLLYQNGSLPKDFIITFNEVNT